jgi:prepilin-type N-terminal cleavage/methylation domain-containing protein/prepilin-type processing-associated H-X9-DG protein
MMEKRGFTLIEMLVVTTLIALLAAILVPSLMKAKSKARRLLCGANLHQLSTAISIYHQEYGRFPYGFSDVGLGTTLQPPEGGCPGTASFDNQGWWWFNYLQVAADITIDENSIAWCPSRDRNIPGIRKNVLCGNYGVNRAICKSPRGSTLPEFLGDPLRIEKIRCPSETMLVCDSGYALVSWTAAIDTGEAPYENPNRVNFFFVPGFELNKTRTELLDNTDALEGRHPNQTLNFIFADGHNDVRPAQSLTVAVSESGDKLLSTVWQP